MNYDIYLRSGDTRNTIYPFRIGHFTLCTLRYALCPPFRNPKSEIEKPETILLPIFVTLPSDRRPIIRSAR